MREEKVFKDAVHGYIHISDNLIWELIQTKEFQRLRRIKQLGGTYMTFHTGEHSRFSHALGVYAIALKMIKALAYEGENFTEEERLLVLTAALLHDLGHGPFSHAFESILEIPHENFTARIIMEKTEVHSVLESYQPGFAAEVCEVILKKHSNPLIVNIISSQLDADRLDYLLRDAYFTGATCGEVDVKRILRTMRIANRKIVYKVSGMHAIEHYLLCRYQMYWQVYLHPTSRSFELVVQRLLLRVKELIKCNYSFNCEIELFRKLFQNTTSESLTEVYLKFDDSVLIYFAMQFSEEADFILKDLADRFLNRRLFKKVYYKPSKEVNEILRQIKTIMIELGIDPTYYLLTDYQMKVPYDYYGHRNEYLFDKIELLMRDGSIKEISEVSEIIQGIVSSRPKKEYKVYFPLDLIENNPNCEKRQLLLELLHERIIELSGDF